MLNDEHPFLEKRLNILSPLLNIDSNMKNGIIGWMYFSNILKEKQL
jgi:hypothetical protein